MVFNTNKEKGNSGLGLAIAYFTTKGYTVSIPLNDTQEKILNILMKMESNIGMLESCN